MNFSTFSLQYFFLLKIVSVKYVKLNNHVVLTLIISLKFNLYENNSKKE